MMENKPTNIWTALAVVSAVIVLACAAIWFLSQFVKSDFALAILGFAGAIATASYQYRVAKNREAEARLFSEKQAIYTELTETIMEIFYSAKEDSEHRIGPEERAQKFRLIRTKLLVWGSFDTILSLDQMGEIGLDVQKTNDPTTGLEWLSRLIAHMRKDLGHKDPKNSVMEIALGLIVPKERVKIREKLTRAGSRQSTGVTGCRLRYRSSPRHSPEMGRFSGRPPTSKVINGIGYTKGPDRPAAAAPGGR